MADTTMSITINTDFILKTQSYTAIREYSMKQPNAKTVAAMLEAEKIAKDPSVKGYDDLNKLFADLKA